MCNQFSIYFIIFNSIFMNKSKYHKSYVKEILHRWRDLYITIWIMIIASIVLYSYFLSIDKKSRDETRYIDLISISDQLKIYYEKNKSYPMPEDAVSITASWEILTYQWYMWDKVFADLWIEPIKDPVWDKVYKYLNYYTYAIDKDKQHFQLMAFYETDKNTDYLPIQKRVAFSYWDQVWIAIEDNTWRPIQETKKSLELLTEKKLFTIYIGEKSTIKWDSIDLRMFVANTSYSSAKSCLEIKDAWWNDNGYYWINPLIESTWSTLDDSFKVYCDNEDDWGGWTRLYYKDWRETCYNDWINYSSGMIDKIFTKDFAVSDNLETLKSEWSWIINSVNFDNANFDLEKMTNVANCKAPSGDKWSSDYVGWYINIVWILSTQWNWNEMFYWCGSKRTIWNNINLRIWWFVNENWSVHKWELIHWNCNDYTQEDNSITSLWGWDNTRVIWVR